MADFQIPTPPTPPLNQGNVSGLIPNKDPLNTLSSIQLPQTFGDQVKDTAKQKIIASATKGRLAKLLKEKAALIKEGIQIEKQHQITLFKLEQAKTPKKQVVNGEVKEIDPELTEEEYQVALIIENGGVLPNGQQIKGNYPEAKENLDKRKKENQKQIDNFLKDPFAQQKAKFRELKAKRKARKKRSKAEKKAARKAKLKAILKSAKAAGKALAPIVMVLLSNKIAEIIAQSDEIGKLVNNTNTIIEEANLSNNPTKLQEAKLARDNAIRIITDNENKLKKINEGIQKISIYISIFSVIVTIISSIPIPTSVPPGVGIPVNLIIRFVKILDKANRIVLILGAYIPSVLLTLEKAIQILNDYKSRLLNINGEIDNASTNSENPEDFLTPTQGSEEFPDYKGFKFALREEDNPKFVVRGYKRRYAVAINKSGIEVLKSEFSFTLDPNDLIEQLKLLIDQLNLSASSNSPIGSTGRGTGRTIGIGETETTETNVNNTFLSTVSPSTLSTAKKAAFTQPPQPKDIKGPTGTITERIPLSTEKKAYLAGLVIAPTPPTPPNVKVDAAFILKEDRKWQAEYKRYQSKTSSDILELES